MPKGRFVRDFGERVREARLERGLSQEELAHRAGMHRTAISFIEQAQRSSTLETIERLAKALKVQPSTLIPDIKLGRS